MGVPLLGYAAPMMHNEPSSMKIHMHPLKAADRSEAVIIMLFLLFVVATIVCV